MLTEGSTAHSECILVSKMTSLKKPQTKPHRSHTAFYSADLASGSPPPLKESENPKSNSNYCEK